MKYGWVAAAVVMSACATVTTAQRPAFPKFLTSADRIFTAASGGGYLTQRGPCLGLASRTGDNFRTVIWPDTANLTVDSGGLLITDSSNGAVIRLGDYVIVGGGALPPGTAQTLASQLTEPIPAECAGSVGTVNPGFRKATPPPAS